MQEMTTAPKVERRIKPRSLDVDFSGVPRHWVGNSPVHTHIANGINLLFPAGERFFLRSVKHFIEECQDDPQLLADVRGFFTQEGQHARAHERQFDLLREQGYDVDGFLKAYETFAWKWLEPMVPPEFRLSITVALEHYTALMAEGAFSDPAFEQNVDPVMKKLLRWHAAEEIEHKSVAFDVLKKVAPSYSLRVSGMLVSTALLIPIWALSTGYLLAQDARAGRPLHLRAARKTGRIRERSIARDVFFKGIKSYLRPDFHPSQKDDGHLATEFLAAAGFPQVA